MASCATCFYGLRASVESLLMRGKMSMTSSESSFILTPQKSPMAGFAPISMPPPIGLLKGRQECSTAACAAVYSQPLLAPETEEEKKAMKMRQWEERRGPRQTKALGEALLQQDVPGALLAIKHGANTAKRYGPRRNTALHLAANMKNPVLMHQLVMSFKHDRAFLDKQNNEGETALMRCVRAGDLELCRVLMIGGCDVNIQDQNGQTALDYAKASSNAGIVAALEATGAKEGTAAVILA